MLYAYFLLSKIKKLDNHKDRLLIYPHIINVIMEWEL